MTNSINAAKFSLEDIKPRKQLAKLKEIIRPNGFIEIVDGSTEEAMKLIVKYVKEELPDSRIVHIGNTEVFGSIFPHEEINTISFPKEMTSEENLKWVLRVRPELFIVRHDFINYMERDYFKQLHLIGHTVIFY